MLDWSKGYSCEWHLYEVNRETWADGDEIPGVRSASVERDATGEEPLVDSGTIDIDMPIGTDWVERYVRIAMVARQGSDLQRVDVATMLAPRNGGTYDRGTDSASLSCVSVLWPASKTMMMPGDFAPKGCDGAEWAARILASAINAPVSHSGSFTLEEHYVFDLGTSALSAAWTLVNAGGFTIMTNGRGEVSVRPKPTTADLRLDTASAKLLLPSIAHELDWSSVPNRYMAMEDEVFAQAVNDDPDSPTSTATRGYVRDPDDGIDDAPTRVDGESLRGYCERRLEELSMLPDTRTYTRKWWPGVHPGSLVVGTLSSVGIEGEMRVERQSLQCGAGLFVEERASKEVYAWRRS